MSSCLTLEVDAVYDVMCKEKKKLLVKLLKYKRVLSSAARTSQAQYATNISIKVLFVIIGNIQINAID